jgi:hypothetical protein
MGFPTSRNTQGDNYLLCFLMRYQGREIHPVALLRLNGAGLHQGEKVMNPINIIESASQPLLREAVEKVRPEMMKIDESRYLYVNLDIMVATGTAIGKIAELVELRSQFLEELPKFDISLLDNLQTYSWAAMQTHSIYLGAYTTPESLPALVDEAAKLVDLFQTDGLALAKRGLLSIAKLDALKGTNGFRNTASDVLTLANMFRSNWQAIAGKTCVTEAELTRAEVLAQQIQAAVSFKEQGPPNVADVARDRLQAYTLFFNAYDQVRRAVIYLRWNQGDADSIAPSLYAGRSNGRKKTTSDVTPTTAETTTTPPTASSVVSSPSAQTPAAVGKVAAGLPGGDPFQS